MSGKRVHSTTTHNEAQLELPGMSRASKKKARRLHLPRNIMGAADVEWFDLLARHRVEFMTHGYLLVAGQRQIDIASAIRAQDHILEGYNVNTRRRRGERARIQHIRTVCTRADELFQRWRSAEPRRRAWLQQRILRVVFDLEFCRNEFKVEVCDQAVAILGFQDGLGRTNPGVMRSRTVKMFTELHRRLMQIDEIAPRIAMRRELLSLERSRMIASLESARANLHLVACHRLFKVEDDSADRCLTSMRELDAMSNYIGVALYYLENVYTAPYFGPAQIVCQILKEGVRPYMRSIVSLLGSRKRVLQVLQRAMHVLDKV